MLAIAREASGWLEAFLLEDGFSLADLSFPSPPTALHSLCLKPSLALAFLSEPRPLLVTLFRVVSTTLFPSQHSIRKSPSSLKEKAMERGRIVITLAKTNPPPRFQAYGLRCAT